MGGNKVTLRPEMTPTLARMVLSLMRAETGDIAALLPLKWFSVPQCWRFETTQRGRKREHYQWNMDIVGVNGISAEVELLSAICSFFESVGITSEDVMIKVNSRKVLGAVLKGAGVPDDSFSETCVIIDKLDKKTQEEVLSELTNNLGLSMEVAKKIVAATGSKTLDEFAQVAGVGDSPEVQELRRLFELAVDYGYGDWLKFDASVVRGLAYYTGVVFGDCVIVELLKERGVLPTFPPSVEFVVAAFDASMMGPAYRVARALRQAGKTVDVYPEITKKVGKAFNYADRSGASKVAFVAPDEWAKGQVRFKDLRQTIEEEKQKDVPFA